MVKAESFQEFTQITNRYGRGISNDFMLPGAAEKLISRGKLFYEAAEDALFIFEEREGCFKLTFRIKNEAVRFKDVMGGKFFPQIFDEKHSAGLKMKISGTDGGVSHEMKPAAFTVNKGSPGKADGWLTANGFKLKQERLRYAAPKIIIPPEFINSVEKDLVSQQKNPPGDFSEVFETVNASVAYPIYRKCFDMVIADLPCPELFEGALCVRNESGEAVGVLSLGADRHIGVLPEYRGRGIAMKLYAMLAVREPRLGTQKLFADADNPASNGLYKKLGFKTDGVVLRCYT